MIIRFFIFITVHPTFLRGEKQFFSETSYFLCFIANTAGPSFRTFMEVVKAVLRQASATNERVAIRAEYKSYSYLQLSASALNISSLLRSKDIEVSLIFNVHTQMHICCPLSLHNL